MKAAVGCGGTGQEDVREEAAVGNAPGGRPGSQGSKAILLTAQGMEPSPKPLSPRMPAGAPNDREAGPLRVWCTQLEQDPTQGAPLSASCSDL